MSTETESVTVTVSDAAWQGRPVWAITCSVHGLVATRIDRVAADRLADEHLDRCIAELEAS